MDQRRRRNAGQSQWKQLPAEYIVLIYHYAQAPKDGTELAIFGPGIAFEPLRGGKGVQFDPLKFGWLGSMNYGVIVANNIDKHLFEKQRQSAGAAAASAR